MRYFSMNDDNTVTPLGSHEDDGVGLSAFAAADEKAPGNSHWIFSEEGLREFVANATKALNS